MADPAAEHDALDVVGHDQQVDRPGEAPADGVRDRERPRDPPRPRRGRRRSAVGAAAASVASIGRPSIASRASRAIAEPDDERLEAAPLAAGAARRRSARR